VDQEKEMQVIAGKAKGRSLITPKGRVTRPLPAMIKESLFGIWQMDIAECFFLDLFAGSGSVGIEALSRGAKQVVFVEKERKAVEVIRKNLVACKMTQGSEVYRSDVFKQIGWLKEQLYRFDFIYLDPPFTVDEIFLTVIKALSDGALLAKDGKVAIRTKKEKEMPDTIGVLQKYRLKIYGISGIHFYVGTHYIEHCILPPKNDTF